MFPKTFTGRARSGLGPIVRRVRAAVRNAMLSVTAIGAVAVATHAQDISPRALVEVADLTSPVVSPNGKSVAFRLEQATIERNAYDSFWYVQDTDGKAPPRRVADGGVLLRDSAGIPLPVKIIWSPDGRWIYYRAMIGGRIDVWRAASDGSGAEPVTFDPADVSDFYLNADGKTLSFSVGAARDEVIKAEEEEYDRGIRIDSSVPIGQPLFRSGNIAGRLETQRYGAVWFDRASLLADAPVRWKSVELEARHVRELPASGAPESPLRPPQLLPDAWALALDPTEGRIALLTRVGGDEDSGEEPAVELVMLPGRQPRKPVRCRAEACTNSAITDIQWRPSTDEVLFTVTDPREGLSQSIYRWNVETGAVAPVTRARGQLSGGRDRSSPCGLSYEALICVAAAADRPPRLERIDLETGSHRILFDPNASLAQAISGRTPARLLRWTDSEGQEFTGQFFVAPGTSEARPPLFVTYYRCAGFLRGGVGDEWPLASLAEQGISALCINDPPGFPLDAVVRYNRALAGVESAIDLLAAEGLIDRSRVGMGGLSFGSEVTLWTAIKSDLLVASSVASPVRTPNHYVFSSLKGDAFFSGFKKYWQLGAPAEDPVRWAELSPAYNIDKIGAPMLLQMPEQEYIISLEYVIPLILKRKADLYVFPHEPHQKFQPRHKLAAYERNLDWFRFWLQGYEDPDPSKAAQYSHWRNMRSVAPSPAQ